MSAGIATAAVLLDVLDRTQDERFQTQLEESGGKDRPDGTRPLMWEMRFKLAHVVRGDTPWMAELEHTHAHLLAAETPEELRAGLIQHAAITAAWVAALDARSAESQG